MLGLSKKLTTILTTAVFSLSMFSSVASAKDAVEIQDSMDKPYQATIIPEDENNEASIVESGDYGLCGNVKDGVILHAFCWSFSTIKENMKDIADAGYTTVQTSPANACNDSHPQMKLFTDENGTGGCWWWQYQPTDWTIGNYQLGSKEDYKTMCDEADKYGIKIITDVIPNHTTPEEGRVAQGLKDSAGGNLYHTNGHIQINDGGDWSWGNRMACTTGQMGGLPDVNTEDQGFQSYYLKYCNDLIDLGCDGFRYDTAKHIGVPSDPKDPSNTRGVNDFWDVATGKKEVNGVKLKNADKVFIYGEVLQGDNVPTEVYAQYMEQTASSFGDTLRGAIRDKNFSVDRISNWQHSNPDRIVTWVESHDTYCNKHESTWMSDWHIRMAWALITARSQGTPLFFSRPDGSDAPSGNYWGNNVLGVKGNAQFKDPEVKGVNKFRNAMVGQGETLRNPNGNNQILQIDRGTKGTCIINLGDAASIDNETSMADGTYKDQINGGEFTVSGGKIKGSLKGGAVAAIYNPTNGGSSSGDSGSTSGGSTSGGSTSGGSTSGGSTSGGSTSGSTSTQGKNVAYVKLPSEWTTVYAYVYNDTPGAAEGTPVKNNAKWPGVEMTKVSDGLYKYEMPTGFDNPLLIFNGGEGTTQYPAKETPGLKCTGTMIYDGTEWKAYDDGSSSSGGSTSGGSTEGGSTEGGSTEGGSTEGGSTEGGSTEGGSTEGGSTEGGSTEGGSTEGGSTEGGSTEGGSTDETKEELKVSLTASPSTLTQDVGTDIKLSAKASGGDGSYKYKFIDGSKTIYEGSKSSCTWNPSEGGKYNVKVIVTSDGEEQSSSALKYTINDSNSGDDQTGGDNEGSDETSSMEFSLFKVSQTKNLKVGDTITISASVTGASGSVKYKFYAKKDGITINISSFSSKSSVDWEIPESGSYEIYAQAKDSSNTKTVDNARKITVSEEDNQGNSSDSFDNNIILGMMILLAISGVSVIGTMKKQNN